jgi:hypothetical protein
MSSLHFVLATCVMFAITGTARADDPIVGNWKGTLKQDDGEPFAVQLTFVSPNGGISRYPSSPCGGMLAGAPRDDRYEYTETITWGTQDELEAFCIGGDVVITLEGDVMKFSWSAMSNGTQTNSVGELKRQSARRKR